MKAMLIDENKNLVWSDVETPTPKDDEILIKIHVAHSTAPTYCREKVHIRRPKAGRSGRGLKYPASLKIWATKQKKGSGKQIG